MKNVHWLGAGLSATPGIRRLCEIGIPLVVYDPIPEAASQAIAPFSDIKNVKAVQGDWTSSIPLISPGDVVVSMLPASFHDRVGQYCLSNSAHFVTASYCSGAISDMQTDVASGGLRFITEIGLDPGIDHLFAHKLIETYLQSSAYHPDNRIRFTSYCGGIPLVPNDFRYKFSWSPKGVLSALRSPATWIENSEIRSTPKPWVETKEIPIALGEGNTEVFEAYPNRDSLPFLGQYHFNQNWHVEEFVRGSLRLQGWRSAWKDVFAKIDSIRAESELESILSSISDDLWRRFAYQKDEFDRVVLHVQLQAVGHADDVAWRGALAMDEAGDPQRGSAMSRLVSLPVSYAVESIVNDEIPAGVHRAISNATIVNSWLSKLKADGNQVIESEG